jgi:predicted GIY-YIG superfamily endonuclease
MSKFIIYILQLNNSKYYIGKTNQNPEERFNQHLNDNGSSWTGKYRPLNIIKTYETNCLFEEDKITKEYMINYGI